MLSKEEEFKRIMNNPIMKDWYDERPPDIQQMIQNYPWEHYIIGPETPMCEEHSYLIGTKVELLAYSESGKIMIRDFEGNVTRVKPEYLIPY